ncbi:MAG: hypothetical protein M1819_006244 [Sarea resinae]|nr:MAG: hypothetical protein M1819_006244 [Sarea resinae]
MASNPGVLSPLASPLPPAPQDEPLTPAQWTTLLAIADTVIPAVKSARTSDSSSLLIPDEDYTAAVGKLKESGSGSRDERVIEKYLFERASDVQDFRNGLHRTLACFVRQDLRKSLALVLYLLNPALGPILDFPRVGAQGKREWGFDFDFLQFPPGYQPEVVDTDVVIIGSGCGGGVCAKNIAEAGHRVIVVDKSYHHPPQSLPMSEQEGSFHLFTNGGAELSDDSSINTIAGQAWGGGGTINWSASLQTQGYVRKEWAEGGLPFFTSSAFQDCLDRVCHRMGVSANQIKHNHTNCVLLEGARKLGYSVKDVPQNTAGNTHYCGRCSLGCGAAEKQGPAVTWLPDAAAAGARFVEGFDAQRILFEEKNGERVAAGVQGTWTSRDANGGLSGGRHTREVIIQAKKVTVSAGSLNSPLVLLRSGLRNSQIVYFMGAVYDHEVRPWEGGILTTVCDEFQNLDGHGHGPKLEATTMLPSKFLTLQPWLGGLEYKLLCAKFNRMSGFISLTRDRDPGRVFADPHDGRCRVQYSPSAFDRANCLEGVIALAKINYVAGAREIFVALEGMPTFVREDRPARNPTPDHADDGFDGNGGINDPAFQAWLSALRRRALPSPDANFISAHQMGTCRMGRSPTTSVVDPRGQVWGTRGLYVADTSVFPSASGANPMITALALADWISSGLVREMRVDLKARM